jgi:anti-sigma B factor antagonist
MPRAPISPDSIAARAKASMPRFTCSWSDGALNAAWVHLSGELDIDTTPRLEQTLSDPESQARLVVVDMRELAFMDSSGVHAIVNASARARQRGRRLVVLRGPPEVDRVFALTGNSADVESREVEPSARALMRLHAADDGS